MEATNFASGTAGGRTDARANTSASPEPGFGATLRAEALKGRRGAGRKVALVAPLPYCLLGTLASGVFEGTGAIGAYATYGWNYWSVLMLPIACALLTASVANVDARQKLRPVLGLPLPPARTWWAKVLYALALTVASCLVVAAFSCTLSLLGTNSPALPASLATVGVLAAASAWMVPAGLVLTTRFGTLVGIAVPAVAQIALGIVCYGSSAWFCIPGATALCAAAPFLGVAPSGIPLEAGDALGTFGWQAAAGIAVALAVFALFAVVGARWFSKREAL